LIQRAKAKKNYAKVLKEEGMASNRLGVEKEKGKGRERVGLVKDPYAAFKKDGAGSDSDDEDEEEKGTEVELMKAGRKRALSTSPEPAASTSASTTAAVAKSVSKPFKPTSEMRRANRMKGKERETPLERSTSISRPVQEKEQERERERPTGRPTPYDRKEVQTPEEKPPSLRGMKKEAFAKRYPVNPVIRGAPVGRGRGGSFGASFGRRGQPNMGARMGVLLEAIKRGGK
jgi:hypothetical protein